MGALAAAPCLLQGLFLPWEFPRNAAYQLPARPPPPRSLSVCLPCGTFEPPRLATHTFPWNTGKGSALDGRGMGQGSRAQSQGQDLGLCRPCVPRVTRMPRPR